METPSVSVDKVKMISNAAQTQLKLLGAPGGSFDALLSQLAQMGASQDVAAEMPQNSLPPQMSSSLDTDLSTPVEQLEYSLNATGQPLERFEVSSEDRDKVLAVLEESGYSQEDAEAIVQRSTDDDGNINLGAMFQVMQEFTPSEDFVLRIAPEDKASFIQVLKEMGLGDEQIKQISDSMQLKDGFYEVSNLDEILKAAQEAQELYGYKNGVDKGVLKNLLGQLGLEDDEITTLLEQGTDTKGEVSSDAALAILKKAAAKQDQGVSDALKELAAKVKVTASQTESDVNSTAEAKRIKDQVNKILQVMETNGTKDQASLKDALKAALAKEGDDKSALHFKHMESMGEVAVKNPTQVKAGAESAATREDGGQGFQFSKEQSAATQVKAESASSEAGAKSNTALKTSGEGLGLANTARASEAAKASGPRATLPTYVVRQVSDKLATMAKNGQSTLKLNLKPPEMGGVNLQLSVKDGVVKATLMADTAAAKTSLEAGADQLKQMLAQQGLKVEKLEISLSPNSADAQAQNNFQEQLNSRQQNGQTGGTSAGGFGAAAADSDGEAALSAARYTGNQGGISLFA